ncbi:MAG: branched-chain amino acid ABC transporter permease [Proteobacteria bacterium]|nr:branched-chain amino acid ABC transporter permease [Pseudomonadota bacterium]
MTSLAAAKSAPRAVRFNAAVVLMFAVLALVPLAAAFGPESYVLGLVTRVMVFAIAALAVDLLCGFGGLVTFGHAAFVGLGAYTVAIAGAHGVTDMTITLPLALAVSAAFAYVTGTICLRTSGVYFIMITLAFGQMAYFIAGSLAPYGGDDGITLPARSTLFGFAVFGSDRALYYATLGFLLASYLLCRAVVYSRFGRVFRGARENSTRMATIGFDVFRFQRVGYVIAGCLGGLAGFLLANATEFVSPAYMSWQRSGELIIMVLFGGLGTLHGAIVGAASYLLLEEGLAGLTENWKLVFGPMLVLIVLFARGGLVGLAASIKARFSRE